MVTIDAGPLRLREFTLGDYEAVHAYASDPRVCTYLEFGPNTREETLEFLREAIESSRANPRLHFEFAVEHPEDGLVGGCGVYVQSLDSKRAEVGYALNSGYWGRGYGTTVAAALIEYGFNVLRMHRMQAMCDPLNVASWKVMEKNGMTREGLLRHYRRVHGEWKDRLIYSVLEDEYGSKAAASHRAP